MSALDLEADGQSGITLSDHGDLLAITLERDDGVLSGGTLVPWSRLCKIDGDIERIAYNRNGPYFFSFEAPAHVISINDVGEIKELLGHIDFAKMTRNRQPEALGIHANGTFHTLLEVASHLVNGFELYALKEGLWQVVAHIPSRGFFIAVGADFGPDNLLYFFERSVSPLGFRTHVRRFDLDQDDLAEEILLKTGQLSHASLEGISVWVDPKGVT